MPSYCSRPSIRRTPAAGRRDTVTVAAVLLVYAACAGTLGARMLGRARWPARAPLLAIITYLTAAWSVVAALGLAGVTCRPCDGPRGRAESADRRLRIATPGRLCHAGGRHRRRAGLTLAGAAMARAVVTAVTHLRAVRQHARAARANRPPGRAPDPALRHPGRPRPASRLLHRGARPDGYPDHRRAADAGSRSGRCRPGARASAPGQSPPPAAGHRENRAPDTALPSADAGCGHADHAAGRDARRRCGRQRTAPRGRWPPPWWCSPPQPVPRRGSPPRLPTRYSGSSGCSGQPEPTSRVRRQLLRAGAAALALTPVLLALTPAIVALALGRIPGA